MDEIQEAIQELMEGIWEEVLGMTIEPSPTDQDVFKDAEQFTATVHITGDWDGAVILSCSPDLAWKVASGMFQMEVKELAIEEVVDAIGEVVNMIGGQYKTMLPGSSALSLPQVAEAKGLIWRIPGGKLVVQLPMRSVDQPLLVSVIEREAA